MLASSHLPCTEPTPTPTITRTTYTSAGIHRRARAGRNAERPAAPVHLIGLLSSHGKQPTPLNLAHWNAPCVARGLGSREQNRSPLLWEANLQKSAQPRASLGGCRAGVAPHAHRADPNPKKPRTMRGRRFLTPRNGVQVRAVSYAATPQLVAEGRQQVAVFRPSFSKACGGRGRDSPLPRSSGVVGVRRD